jgi:hypothetical protein
MSVAIIQQRISAGNNFDGTLPSTTPVSTKDIKRFPVDAAGGLFDFAITSPHWISAIEFIGGGQTSWTIHKKDSDGDEVLLWQGTDEANFVTCACDKMQIYEEEKLLLRTVGASTAMKCRIALDRQ